MGVKLLESRRFGGAGDDHAGVVDEDVQTGKALASRGEHLLPARLVGDVLGQKQCAARRARIERAFEFPPGPLLGGSFPALGSLLLKFPVDAGRTILSGRLSFQQCSEALCEPPETIAFELPLTIEPFMVPAPKK